MYTGAYLHGTTPEGRICDLIERYSGERFGTANVSTLVRLVQDLYPQQGELSRVVSELKRLEDIGVCDGHPCLVIDPSGCAFLIPDDDWDCDGDELPNDADAEVNLIEWLSEMPVKKSVAELQDEVWMKAEIELTPEYLRKMANKMDAASE